MTAILHNTDYKDARSLVGNGTCDLVILHPPFVENDSDYVLTTTDALHIAHNKLKEDGIAVIIQHDKKKQFAPPRHALLIYDALALGWQVYGQKIWHRQKTVNLFRHTFGYVTILAKGEPKVGKYLKEITQEYHQDVWFFADTMRRGKFKDAFPLELPKRLIKGFTPENGVVLDLFAGVGTTLVAANALGRSSIGFEIDANLAEHWSKDITVVPRNA